MAVSTTAMTRKGLPTLGELEHALEHVMDGLEEFGYLADRVFGLNTDGKQEVTWEQIGQLLATSRNMREYAGDIADRAAAVERRVAVELAAVCQYGSL